MPRSGPRKIQKYSAEFKVTAVKLSQQPGLQVQTVARALEIHPFMLSKWRKEAREGRLRGRVPKAGDEWQHLPMRDVHAHPSSDSRRGEHDCDAGGQPLRRIEGTPP